MPSKRFFLLLCPIVAAIAIASAIGADSPQSSRKEPSKQLEDLLRERRDTLRKVADILESRFRGGYGVTEETALLASNEVLEAELELAPTKADRVAIFVKVVANLQKIEKTAERRRGLQCEDVFLHAKAARLKAEIQLLREKEGASGRDTAKSP
jgi:hypothetical protein